MNFSADHHDVLRICYVRDDSPYRGVFYGDSPFSNETALLLAQLSLCAFVTLIMQLVFNPLGQSVFISQILAGVLIGSQCLGRISTFSSTFFPVESFYVVDTFAYFGVMLFLFILGVKTDLSLVRKLGDKVVVIGASAFMLPLVFNITLSQILIIAIPMDPKLHKSIMLVASFLALSSFHVIICLLVDLKLKNSELGRLAISSSMISGLGGCIWVVIVFSWEQGGGTNRHLNFIFALISTVTMFLFVKCIFRPTITWVIQNTSNPKSLKESYVCIIFIIILMAAIFGELVGQHFLMGPIILGITIPAGPPLGTALVTKLECFISSVFLPIFFVVTGVRIDFSVISLRHVVIMGILAFSSVAWKVVGVVLPSLYYKMQLSEAFYLGLILSNQGILEVIVIGRAASERIIDHQSYSIVVILIVLITGILCPIVKFSYKPDEKCEGSEGLTLQYADPNSELRILACLHFPEHIPSIINLFEASYPQPGSPICFYAVHLLELAGRSAPVLVAHHPGMKDHSVSDESDHIINALRFFELSHQGCVLAYPFTVISQYASMHYDVCTLAAAKQVSLVIILFHMHPVIQFSKHEAKAIRAVNRSILTRSSSSVGILIDCSSMQCNAPTLPHKGIYKIGVIFLGGPDDREAMTYARRMSKRPSVCLTVVRFVDSDIESACSCDLEEDIEMINEYREVDMNASRRCSFQEEIVKDSVGVVNVIKRMMIFFDMILVGRRHDEGSPLLAGISEWNEYPELGCVGDMLYSSYAESQVSVLVVQQALPRLSKAGNPEYIKGNSFDSSKFQYNNYNDSKVWPASHPSL